MTEYGIFSDEGMIEGLFTSKAEAEAAIAKRYDADDELKVFEVCSEHGEHAKEGCEHCEENCVACEGDGCNECPACKGIIPPGYRCDTCNSTGVVECEHCAGAGFVE